MRSRILLSLAAAVAVIAVVAPGATGAAKRTRTLDATIHMAMIGPNGDSGSKFAGGFAGKPVGTAALLFKNTVTGSTSNGSGVLYAKRGTIRATATNELQPQPDGSVKLPGTFKITGGTGRYRGATGSGTFDAVLPANSTIFEVTVKGKIRY
jgi:hypothetical protein